MNGPFSAVVRLVCPSLSGRAKGVISKLLKYHRYGSKNVSLFLVSPGGHELGDSVEFQGHGHGCGDSRTKRFRENLKGAIRVCLADAHALLHLPVFMSNFTFPAARMRIRRSCRASVLLLLGSSRCCSEYRARGLSSAASTSSSLVMIYALSIVPKNIRGRLRITGWRIARIRPPVRASNKALSGSELVIVASLPLKWILGIHPFPVCAWDYE